MYIYIGAFFLGAMKTGKHVAKTPTGVPGFDELVNGGIPTGAVVCLTGPPGSAKTLFGMQFIFSGITQHGEKGVYVTLDEHRESILKAMASFGMELEEYEREGLLFFIDMGEIRKMTSTEERLEKKLVEFNSLTGLLENVLKTSNAKRLVVDSIVPLALPYDSDEELREELFRFVTFLHSKGVTSLLLTEAKNDTGDQTRHDMEQYIADGFISLGLERIRGELLRTISVRKMRFTKHDTAIHPFLITSTGIEISPEERVV
jgi:KaiC/GvpD/RAD55 family RecA-like ATPase